MVDEEPVGLMEPVAVPPEGGGDRLTFLPGIDEDQTLFPPGVLEDIADAGIGVFRGVVGLFLQHLQGFDVRPVLSGLDILDIKMLHAEPPFHPFGFDFWDAGFPPGAHGKKGAGALRVADGGGQADSSGVDPGKSGKPLDKTQGLAAPVPPQEGMDLVNDHEPQVSKELGNGGVFVQEHGFQRFRGNLQNAGGVLH